MDDAAEEPFLDGCNGGCGGEGGKDAPGDRGEIKDRMEHGGLGERGREQDGAQRGDSHPGTDGERPGPRADPSMVLAWTGAQGPAEGPKTGKRRGEQAAVDETVEGLLGEGLKYRPVRSCPLHPLPCPWCEQGAAEEHGEDVEQQKAQRAHVGAA